MLSVLTKDRSFRYTFVRPSLSLPVIIICTKHRESVGDFPLLIGGYRDPKTIWGIW